MRIGNFITLKQPRSINHQPIDKDDLDGSIDREVMEDYKKGKNNILYLILIVTLTHNGMK